MKQEIKYAIGTAVVLVAGYLIGKNLKLSAELNSLQKVTDKQLGDQKQQTGVESVIPYLPYLQPQVTPVVVLGGGYRRGPRPPHTGGVIPPGPPPPPPAAPVAPPTPAAAPPASSAFNGEAIINPVYL